MDIKKPNRRDIKRSLLENVLRWILSNLKGTPEHFQKEMEKWIKY